MAAPLLCLESSPRDELIAVLRNDLEQISTFDRARDFVDGIESSKVPYAAALSRCGILLDVYRNEYHTDAKNVDRVVQRIENGDELIWFWGSADSIARLRASFQSDRCTNDISQLGTATITSIEHELGLGYGESCRSGSRPTGIGAKAAFMQRMLDYLTGDPSSTFTGRFHSIVSATRNCAPSSRAASGAAIHHIGKRYMRSRFWGYAPWYVMPGNVLEMLELREVNRNPDDVRRALVASPPWHFASSSEAEYASALVVLNFGLEIATTIARPERDSINRFHVTTPATPSLNFFNHGSLSESTAANSGADVSLDEGLAHLDTLGVSSQAVFLDLTNPQSVTTQGRLHEYGFHLGAILPPKDSWVVSPGGASTAVKTRAIGIWNRPRPDMPLISPYYIDHATTSDAEQVVIAYVRRLLQCGPTTAV